MHSFRGISFEIPLNFYNVLLKEEIKNENARKYVLAFPSKVENYLIPKDTNLVKLFNLGNCFILFRIL